MADDAGKKEGPPAKAASRIFKNAKATTPRYEATASSVVAVCCRVCGAARGHEDEKVCRFCGTPHPLQGGAP
jgi:hypothetical protein